jgi:hypothetical protein
VYGYLPKHIKETVNNILKSIADDENISELYDIWCELEKEKYSVYSGAEKQIPPIESQSNFKSIKNEIIRQVNAMDINFDCQTNVQNTALSMIKFLAKLIQNDYEKNLKQEQIKVDSKLKRAISRKKQALGIKEEHGIEQSY